MSILQEAGYRFKTIKYAERFGVAKTAANYHTSEKNIYPWRKLLKEGGGDILSLARTEQALLKVLKRSKTPTNPLGTAYYAVIVSIICIHLAYSYTK